MISSTVQNIIFDLGGVIIHLNTHRTIEALAALGGISLDQAEWIYSNEEIFKSYERGELSPEEFFAGLRRLLNTAPSDEELTHAWNAMLLHIPAENVAVLRQIRSQYKLYLLSNTNIVHIEEVHRRLEQLTGEANFSSFFDKVYYSQDIGARKPEPEAYQLILDEWNLEAGETLFIDDNKTNLLGAEQLGIQTLLFPLNGNLPALFTYGS